MHGVAGSASVCEAQLSPGSWLHCARGPSLPLPDGMLAWLRSFCRGERRRQDQRGGWLGCRHWLLMGNKRVTDTDRLQCASVIEKDGFVRCQSKIYFSMV